MSAFEEYVDQYGHHFNKKLYEWAVSMMKNINGEKIPTTTKEEADEWLHAHGVTVKNNKGYDAAYVLAMAKADFLGSSIKDDSHLALFVRDFLDDIDGNESKAFDHFVVDCRTKHEPIFWDMMM
ncbi:MAG: hypothetical protein J6Y20_04670 [Lachnospiraceae bacterium]|nr:hypothetical protein [Kiritimatiellia bacterium]MBP5461399.1 hypothetical protein [Lachnospiraceae bacterium]